MFIFSNSKYKVYIIELGWMQNQGNVLSIVWIPFQPRSDERDIVGALGLFLLSRLFIVPFHISSVLDLTII